MSVKSFMHLKNTAIITPCEQYKDDLLLAYDKLDRVKDDLKTYKKSLGTNARCVLEIPEDLEHIVKIYNENAWPINSKVSHFNFDKTFSYEFEEYKKECAHLKLSNEELRSQYGMAKHSAEHQYNKIKDEAYQFVQVGILYKRFLPKLNHVIQKALAQNLAVGNLPKLKVVFDEPRLSKLLILEPSLRVPEAVVIAQRKEELRAQIQQQKDTASSTSSTSTSTQTVPAETSNPVVEVSQPQPAASVPSTPDQSVPTETSKPVVEVSQPQPVTSVSATVEFPLTNGVLGICHAPSWGEQPVLFTPGEKGWLGQIPVNEDFKLVIVENGKVTQWEVGLNRRFTAENPSVALNADQVKFS